MIRALAALVLTLSPAAAAETCRLALILGLDISSSVDPSEDRLQRLGLARALVAPEVVAAALSSPDPVALAVFEWSGRDQQDLLLDWILLQTGADLRRASAIIGRSRRSYAEFPTAIGTAIRFAGAMFDAGPDCQARTLDLSGDGVHNDGPGPVAAYRDPAFDAITVNGLVIPGAHEDLLGFYRDVVLHGPRAFLEIADGFADYERAMRRKLVREMGTRLIGDAGRAP